MPSTIRLSAESPSRANRETNEAASPRGVPKKAGAAIGTLCKESIFVRAGLALPCSGKSVSSLMCLPRGTCALSRIVVRKKILNCRAYTGFIEQVKQFVRARRAPKIILFWDAWIIRTVRNCYRTTGDLLIRRESQVMHGL